MKLVIDIPSHVKNRLIFGVTYKDDLRILVEALTNGTPLPKRHGRLIDADLFVQKHPLAFVRDVINDAPTIIEADGGREE